MTMPASIAGDMSIGHAGFSPAPITPTTATVLVMGAPPHIVGALIGPHVLGQAVHTGTVGKASSTVLVTNQGLARLLDKADCPSLILGSAATVLVGGYYE